MADQPEQNFNNLETAYLKIRFLCHWIEERMTN